MGLLDKFNQLKAYIDANTPRNTRPPVSVSKVINEGLLNPNKYNAPAANRFKDSALGLLGGVPGAGDYASGVQAADYWNRGEKGNALLAGVGALPVIPSLVGAGATLGGLGAMHKVAQKIGKPLPAGPARKQAGAIVYHGSPHKFDKFDMSKIGTGEGAQAYGHGLYFAENPDVAVDYQRKLSSTGAAQRTIAQNTGDVNAALAAAQNSVAHYRALLAGDGGGDPRRAQGMLSIAEKKLQDIQRVKEGLPENTGAFYKVDIPDESIPKMLDWDKPLSKQPEGVRVAVQDLGLPANATGKDAYNALALLARDGAIARGNNGTATTLGSSQSAASVDLQGYGIPGIRYLDGASRGDGAGTSNYVLFDDQLPRILEVNGQPTGLLSWADEAKQTPKKPKGKP